MQKFNYIDIYNYKIIGNKIKDGTSEYEISLKNINEYMTIDNENYNNQDNSFGSIDILNSIKKQNGGTLFNYDKMELFYKKYIARRVLNKIDSLKTIYDKDYMEHINSLFMEANIIILKTYIKKKVTTREYIKKDKLKCIKNNPYEGEIESKNKKCRNIHSIINKCENDIIENYIHTVDFKIMHDGGFVYKLKTTNKLVIFGDLHGSYHSFFRNLLRLQKKGIIDMNNFKINSEYTLIFLGDIIDRGNYGLEILTTLVKFFVVNNKDKEINDWKIYINRGNHEQSNVYEKYGFSAELEKKINNEYYESIYIFLSLMSTALIIEKNQDILWLCHGGFALFDCVHGYTSEISYVERKIAGQIRNNDFGGGVKDKNYKYRGNIITSNEVKTFGASFIIRGHQDSITSASLLSDVISPPDKCINDIIDNMKNVYMANYDSIFWYLPYVILSGEYVKCNCSNNSVMFDGPIYRITIPDPKHNIVCNTMENIKCNYAKTYIISPVLTISTNNDIGRNIPYDSFIIIHDNINFMLSNSTI